jgi:oligopeptide transport system ATP-binding protein
MLSVSASSPALSARSLRKVFHVKAGLGRRPREIIAVDDVSFDIPPQQNFGIIGESGSGKSTIARMMLGLEVPTEGEISFFGTPYIRHRRTAERLAHARQIQMVFQDPYSSLDPRQSIGGGLRELLRLHGADDHAARHESHRLLEQVGLSGRFADVRPLQLSGGQRQRVAIARALAVKPRFILLDEAVASLDVSIQAQILNMLAEIQKEMGVQYILISHNLAVVRQLTDLCIVMHRGKVVEEGRTEHVLLNPQHEYTIRLKESIPTPSFEI